MVDTYLVPTNLLCGVLLTRNEVSLLSTSILARHYDLGARNKSERRHCRNLPRAIWIAMPMVTIIYVMANLAYFAVVSRTEMLSDAPVAVV